MIESKIGYPRLQHFIISRFPQSKWFLVGNVLIVLYDLIQIVLVYILSSYLLDIIHPEITQYSVVTILSYSGWIALLFSSSPMFFPISARLTGLGNARTIGNLFLFLLMVIWMPIQLYDMYYLLPVAFLLVCLIILSSLFALQVMFFNFIFLSIFYLDFVPVIFILCSVVFAYFLPIRAKDVLLFKYNHWRWFFKNAQEGTTAYNRNKIKDFISLPIYLIKDVNFFLYKIINHLTPVILLYSVPSIIIYFINWGYLMEILLLLISIISFLLHCYHSELHP